MINYIKKDAWNFFKALMITALTAMVAICLTVLIDIKEASVETKTLQKSHFTQFERYMTRTDTQLDKHTEAIDSIHEDLMTHDFEIKELKRKVK